MTNEYNPDGKEIRFIDSHYKDLFHIPDGSCVQIHYPDEMVVKPCTFIDEYHTQIGYNVFHICQFAEIMERNGASYMPEPEIMGDEAAWKVGKDRILAVQTCEDGYDYTLLDENYNEIDGGQVDNPELSIAPNKKIGNHIHEKQLETHEVISGAGVCLNNGAELPYEAGVISIFPIGVPHEVIAGADGLYLFAKFMPALC